MCFLLQYFRPRAGNQGPATPANRLTAHRLKQAVSRTNLAGDQQLLRVVMGRQVLHVEQF
jgi:hypothetical protein